MTTSEASATAIGHPDPSEYAPFYSGYIARVTEEPLVALERQASTTPALLRRIPEASAGHRYAAGKWSVRDIVGHLSDTERVMSYRALRIARGDATPLAGFDENSYAVAAEADRRDWSGLIEEWATLRAATVALFGTFSPEAWHRRGVANGAGVSVRALAHIIAGHERHHLEVLDTRYGLPAR